MFSDSEVQLLQFTGSDEFIAKAARVSFGNFKDLKTKASDERLIRYLSSHGHTSPFNHTFISMYVKAPVFVARQLVKHKFMPWNEVSRRYRTVKIEFFNQKDDEWRQVAENKKQGSLDICVPSEDVLDYFDYEGHCLWARDRYQELLQVGVAPEQARMVLPQSLMTEWVWSGTLGAWADMYNLRKKEDVQKETRTVAIRCGQLIEGCGAFPISWKELTND